MSDTEQWWYARGGEQVGPVAFSALQELANSGGIQPATLVWRTGMSAWTPASTVAELAWPTSVARAPPPLPGPGAPRTPPPSAGASASTVTPPFALPAPAAGTPWTPPSASSAAGAVLEPEELNVTTTILLAIVTFGIFGVIRFYQTARAYERLAGRETRFTLYFWIWAACNVAAWPLGVPWLVIPALVFQFLALGEALRARREGLTRWQLAPQVASDNTHWLYMGLGTLLAAILVGLVFLVLQAVKWFDDWNAIRRAAVERG